MTTMNSRDTVLITGCTGLIGSRLMATLASDYRIVGLDVKIPEDLPPGTDLISCDLTDDDSVATALASVRELVGTRLASVVHLAAYYDFSGEPSPLYHDLTVEGSRRLITALQEFEVEQFIFSSSLLVMKPTEDDSARRLTEDSPVRAEWDYPRSKLEAESVLRQRHGGIPLVILRIAGVYDEDGHSLPIVHQIQRIAERRSESVFFPGDADHGQPFVHLNDLSACVRAAIQRRTALSGEELFLIAEPEVMSYRDLQAAIGMLLYGKPWNTLHIPAALAKVGAWTKEKLLQQESFIRPWMIDLADDNYPTDIERARQVLGWHPQHRLRATLPEMIRRLKDDPRHWYMLNHLHWSAASEQLLSSMAMVGSGS